MKPVLISVLTHGCNLSSTSPTSSQCRYCSHQLMLVDIVVDPKTDIIFQVVGQWQDLNHLPAHQVHLNPLRHQLELFIDSRGPSSDSVLKIVVTQYWNS